MLSSREHRSAYDSAPENDRLERLHNQLHLHTNNLGIIDAVRGNRADVTLAQRKKHNGEDITVKLIDLPIHVVCIGDFYIDAEAKAGGECRVYFCEREIESFITGGSVSNSAHARIHDLADAYIVPSCLSDTAIANLGDSVGLLKCVSDLAQVVIDLSTAVGPAGAPAGVAASLIKIKIDGVRS